MVGSDPIAAMIEQSLAGITETPAPVASATPAVPVTVPGETPVEAAQTAASVEEAPVVPDIAAEDPDTPEQLLNGVLDPNSTRGQKIWHAYSLVRDLVKPESEGGIGHEPTVEDVRIYHGNHLTLNQMLTDFESQPGTFIAGMANVNPEAAAQMITELPKVLDKMAAENPHMAKAQEGLYEAVNEATVTGLVDLAKGSTGDMQKFYFNLAKNLKYFISGGKVTLQDTMLAEPLDPLANERKQLEAREQRLQSEEQQRAKRMWEGFRTTLFTGLDNKLADTFAWPKEIQENFYFGDLSARKMAEVRSAVGSSNVARSELDAIMNRAQAQLRAGQDVSATMQQFQQTYLKYARPHIARIRADVLSKAGTLKPAATAARTGQQTPAPAAASAVTPPSLMPDKKKPGEGFEDYALRVMNQALTGVQ